MNLEQKITEEKNLIAGKIETLASENRADSEDLKELNEKYRAAILSSNEDELDSINEDIKKVSVRINRRSEKIKAMNEKNNPVIQQMVSEEVSNWLNERNILTEQSEKLFNQLEPKHAELLKGFEELNNMRHRINHLREYINRHSEFYLSDYSRKELGISKAGLDAAENTATKAMRSLLIESGKAFRSN